MEKNSLLILVLAFLLAGCAGKQQKAPEAEQPLALYEMQPEASTRWASFENPQAAKGQGGKENQGAKGRAFERLAPGERKVLLDVQGSGVVRRMWITIMQKDPETLRSLRIEMFWDGNEEPAVSAPFGDFFGSILGRNASFQNEFFSNPEGRSYNCFIPMPFRKGARIEVANDAPYQVSHIFYDVNFTLEPVSDDALYFHAFWNHSPATELGVDFEVLPKVEGRGKYLGAHIGAVTNPVYEDHWWGEGEVKVFLDGDSEFPTLVGTGTEDYIGTGWGQGVYFHRYQGCTLKDGRYWGFYRYHVPDPVYFHEDCRVTLQQIGGSARQKVAELYNKGVPMIPISIDAHEDGKFGDFVRLLEMDPVPPPDDPSLPDGHMNYYRSDQVCSIAFFYLDKPATGLPAIEGVNERIYGLEEE